MRYTKRPVTIDAMQWHGHPKDAHVIISWIERQGGTAEFVHLGGDDYTIAIETMEGRSLDLKPGGWVIRGVKGEFYPCDEQVFAETYEPAEEDE